VCFLEFAVPIAVHEIANAKFHKSFTKACRGIIQAKRLNYCIANLFRTVCTRIDWVLQDMTKTFVDCMFIPPFNFATRSP